MGEGPVPEVAEATAAADTEATASVDAEATAAAAEPPTGEVERMRKACRQVEVSGNKAG